MEKSRKKRVFVLLPDGIGLKNFAYSDFPKKGVQNGFEVVFWNKTSFNLTELGFSEVKLPNLKPFFVSTILKNVKTSIFLDYFTLKFKDDTYQSYKFTSYSTSKSVKDLFKNYLFRFFLLLFDNRFRNNIQNLIQFLESNTTYYSSCKSQLAVEKPDFIFCTNQRHVSAIAPLLAAADLGIPTSTFIFSWDNLPKATLVLSTDYYFVWSSYMKNELLSYYPAIKGEQIRIVGTPQFEFYYNPLNIIPEEEFFFKYNMNKEIDYVCFSGDDITTSPFDAFYLRDLAASIVKINMVQEKKIGIIFRRCPVDFSDRYNQVLEEFKDIIVVIDPAWTSFGECWNEIMPTVEDIRILTSTIYYSKMVFNLGSSMVFDFIIFGKPCFYFNYNPVLDFNQNWSVQKIYKFIHFKSMPSKKAVFWIDTKESISPMLLELINYEGKLDLTETQIWFEKIVSVSPSTTSSVIWENITELV